MKQLLGIFICSLLINIQAFSQNKVKFSDIKPGMKDEQLEKEALRIANKRGIDYAWREYYTKAVIISDKWELEYTKNGFLKGRKIHMNLYGKLPQGKCAISDFTFKEKLLPDEKFSDMLYYDHVGDMVYVDCE
jgi:hypothetical protein